MTHKDTYSAFCILFPMYAGETTQWITNGKNCIRVKIISNVAGDVQQFEYVFTCVSSNEWNFETIKNYKNRLKNA